MRLSKRVANCFNAVLLSGCAMNGAGDMNRAVTPAQVYLDRIEAVERDHDLNAVIAYQGGDLRHENRFLQGRAVLVKDNIETREWPTTAGSLALAENATGRDAPIVARVRDAGGVVIGKANLSEWANIRSTNSTSGWSAIGGLTRNPYALDRNSCGSSSGSAAAVAAGLAWAAIGTETDGSISCPASVNGIVGFKPTLGLVSRHRIIPISASQDTAGPMARSVLDAALLLQALAGTDPADPATSAADAHRTDYAEHLADASLAGGRLGVMRNQVGDNPEVAGNFEIALADLRRAGAILVEIDYEPVDSMYEDELTVLLHELRRDLSAYLAASPADIPVRSLADVIAFNKAHAEEELRWFDQDLFEQAEAHTDEDAYLKSLANTRRLAGPEGLERLMAKHEVEFLVAPTTGPAWQSTLGKGDEFPGGIGIGSLAAIAGTPHLTVPMGMVDGLPVGLSLLGARWEDAEVLQAGAVFERFRTQQVPPPAIYADGL
jgi:amidase